MSTKHWSDCARHDAPAQLAGECDCGSEVFEAARIAFEATLYDCLKSEVEGDLILQYIRPDTFERVIGALTKHGVVLSELKAGPA